MNSSHGITFTDLETGIYSFRKLKEGFNKFNFKPTSKAKDAKSKIDSEILTEFEIQLKKLILEIHDINFPFVEKKKYDYKYQICQTFRFKLDYKNHQVVC